MKIRAFNRVLANDKSDATQLIKKLGLGSKLSVILAKMHFTSKDAFAMIPGETDLKSFVKPVERILGKGRVYNKDDVVSYHWFLDPGIISIGTSEGNLSISFVGDLKDLLTRV